MQARWLMAIMLGVTLVGAGCSGGAAVSPTPSGTATEAYDNSDFPMEMVEVEAAWNNFAAAAVAQDYDAFQSFIDVELTELQITSGMGRFVASIPVIDWEKSVFESDVRVELVSTKGAEIGTWSKNTDGTWTLEQRYWKMSNE